MTEQAIENRRIINHAKNALDLGWMTYEEAREYVKPTLENINSRGREIAKKYGKKYHEITFNEIMR